jgi:hypothetical protein
MDDLCSANHCDNGLPHARQEPDGDQDKLLDRVPFTLSRGFAFVPPISPLEGSPDTPRNGRDCQKDNV